MAGGGVRRDGRGWPMRLDDIDRWCGYVLPRQFNDPNGWELQNMLTISRLMIRSALERNESRGVHVRTDFPNVDDDHWQRHLAFLRDARPIA